MIIGDIVYFILGEIVILLFFKDKIDVSLGFTLGVLISVIMIVHMSIALEQALCLNQTSADKHVKKTTAFRMITCFIILLLIGFSGFGNVIAAVVGVMALKVSAYLQPFTHKVLAKKSTEKGR